ncbi:MAG: beta/gamma crystallin-related protein [Caulobacterales bacterium]
MNRFVLALAAGGALAALAAGSLAAQPYAGGGRAILFDQPNFQGRSITILQGSPNLAGQGFASLARSGHFDGDWTACDAAEYRGHCETVSGDVNDLDSVGLGERLTSLRQGVTSDEDRDSDRSERVTRNSGQDQDYDNRQAHADADQPQGVRRPWREPEAPGVQQGVAGHSAIFFIRPERNGADITGEGRQAADAFCRDRDLGPALYYDTDAGSLRDVLCRRE